MDKPLLVDEMRRLAGEATPGPWGIGDVNLDQNAGALGETAICAPSDGLVGFCTPAVALPFGTSGAGIQEGAKNAAFIAAANPSQIIHFCDLIDSQAKVIEGLTEALERIAAATPANTNSANPARAFSWTRAVARTALDEPLPSDSRRGE